jgi:hypothetical protein
VAATVFVSATVELSVPVATPSAFVGDEGWISVFPVPVAVSTTVAPGIRLPNSSRAVTVIVDVPDPDAIGDVAVTLESVADTGAGVTVTAAVWGTSSVFTRADTVFASAVAELKVPIATPFASVDGGRRRCSGPRHRRGGHPITLPYWSRTVTVTCLRCCRSTPTAGAAATVVCPLTGPGPWR